ncbi:MAG TPA: glycerophosphodiester phosphodiesterase [Gaiellaceae bacterium]|nr:glycerophosphodiester phosphodiesterase [Gaiellaceae bacterium]
MEADLRRFRGRVEVRHLKTIGPVRVLWDRWFVAPRSTPRLLLGDLLEAVGPETELVLDLKGPDTRLARDVLAAVAPFLDDRRVTVCSRSWRQLRPFLAEPRVRVLHSVGSAGQLRRLLRRARDRRLQGVSIHARLLTADTAARLRQRADLVVSWPVNTLEEARRLLALGVDGLISDEPERVAAAVTVRP